MPCIQFSPQRESGQFGTGNKVLGSQPVRSLGYQIATRGYKLAGAATVRLENFGMRALALLLAAVAIGFGVYQFYLKKLPTTDSGTAATQAISLTGVRADLLQIAQAERGNVALSGKCASLEELISSGALTMTKTGRDGYTYQISCSGNDFQAVAEHPPALEGSGIRFPKLAIDATMQVQEIQ
jgi:hypothetical protein